MADQLESDPSQKGTKKRSRNPSEWKREKRKRLRIAGKEYINTRGELISGRKIGEDCRCRRKCYMNVSEEVRNKLFEGYYSLNSHDEQNAYLFGLIRKKDIARKRSKDSVRRTCTYTYYVRNRGKEIQVCRLAFAHIHGISSPKIRNLCLKLDMNVMYPRDGRGKHDHRPKKINDDTMQQIRDHIYSIIKTDRVKDFMKEEKNNGPDVNITKMWKDYLRKFEPNINVETITTKSQKSQQTQVDVMEPLNNGAHPHPLHHPVMMGHASQMMSHYGTMHDTGDHFINLGDAERRTNILSSMNNDANNSNGGVEMQNRNMRNNDDSQTDEDSQSDEEDRKRHRPKPLVKHWLYSKVFHEQFKLSDIHSLRKKLWDLKGEKMATANAPGLLGPQHKPASSRLPKSQNNLSIKSERKQKMPKKITRTKEELERLGLDRPLSPEMNTQSSALSAGPSSSGASHHSLHPSDMYILPMQLQDISQMQPQRLQQHALTAMDLVSHTVTTQQPHLAHHHAHHQHHAGMQLNLHSFASQHQNTSLQGLGPMGHQQNNGQLQCLTPNPMQTVNLSQNHCNYMNINTPSFYQ